MAFSFSKDRYNNVENAKFVSDRAFYAIVAAVLLFGFAVNAIEVVFFAEAISTWNPIVFFIVYFVMAVAGVSINVFSRNPE